MRSPKLQVGVDMSIMDHFFSAISMTNHAMLLDCKTLSYKFIPFPEQISPIVLDTLVRHELTHFGYNARREDFREATKLLG